MFNLIKAKVQSQFALLNQYDLFEVELEKNALFDAYLAAFPDAVVRQEHNCNCCKQFLNNYGNVVAIVDNEVKTLWDFEVGGEYEAVPAALRALVLAAPIKNAFISKIAKLGTDSNIQLLPSKETTR